MTPTYPTRTTTLRTIAARPPRWWRRHGRLHIEVHPAGWNPADSFRCWVTAGTCADLSVELLRRFNITEWRWA